MKVKNTSIIHVMWTSLLLATLCYPQEVKKSPGLLLIEKGDFTRAIQLLENSSDLVDLYYLGFANEKSGREKAARNAYEKSFRKGYEQFGEGIISHFNANPRKSAVVEKLSTYLQINAPRIVITALSAQRCLELKALDDHELAMRAQMMAEIGRILASKRSIYAGNEVDTEVVTTAKPRPSYTDEARMRNEQGTIKLAVLYDADGSVKAALPVEKLKYGLTEQAFIAALKISFTPAQKDGKPVATLRITEYSFKLY